MAAVADTFCGCGEEGEESFRSLVLLPSRLARRTGRRKGMAAAEEEYLSWGVSLNEEEEVPVFSDDNVHWVELGLLVVAVGCRRFCSK